MTIQSLFEEALSNYPDGMDAIDVFNNVEIYVGGDKVTGITIEPVDNDTPKPAKIVLSVG